MSETITREQALALGLKRYRDSAPCRNGHVGERYTRNKSCCECGAERVRIHNAQRRKPRAVRQKPPMAVIRQNSEFIAPPSLDRLMARR